MKTAKSATQLEIVFSAPYDRLQATIETLNENGFFSFYYEQPIIQYKEENGYGFTEDTPDTIEFRLYIDEQQEIDTIAAILNIDKREIQCQDVEQKDWQQPFPIIDLQNGWFIKPTAANETIKGQLIHFEPPRAFGSGLHGTTQDCLRFILNKNLTAKKVLDVGAGSGILSVAAAMRGAKEVVAVDIEDVAKEVRYNALLNNVQEYITVMQLDIVEQQQHITDSFDLIIVNIAANVNRKLYPFLRSRLNHNGLLILSGMVEWNYEKTLALFIENHFSVVEIKKSQEWITALLRKVD